MKKLRYSGLDVTTATRVDLWAKIAAGANPEAARYNAGAVALYADRMITELEERIINNEFCPKWEPGAPVNTPEQIAEAKSTYSDKPPKRSHKKKIR